MGLLSCHGHHVDAVSMALVILVVLVDFETWWTCPIRGGVGQYAWVMGLVVLT